MSSHFYCEAFQDLKGRIRTGAGIIHLGLRTADGAVSIYLSISPAQVQTLVDMLQNSLSLIPVEDVAGADLFGGLEMTLEPWTGRIEPDKASLKLVKGSSTKQIA
jgi:hypothetical protein